MQVREIRTHEEYQACLRLQRMVWGEGFGEGIPQTVFSFLRRIAGIVLGAYEGDADEAGPGGLVGLAISFPGRVEGEWIQWSDMVGVHPERQARGIGWHLKVAQRDACLRLGFARLLWTYDPLESRNACLNFAKLGVRSRCYEPSFYGPCECGLLKGVDLDRLIVSWDLARDLPERTQERGPAPPPEDVALAARHDTGEPREPGEPRLGLSGPGVWLEVPRDFQGLKSHSLERAVRWREASREAFCHYLGRGYEVTGFVQAVDGRCFYRLDR